MGTLSKALGSFGGFVACDSLMKDYLINKSRSLIFSTALPPSAVGAARASLNIVRQEPAIRRRLWANVELLKNRLQAKGFDLQPSQSPILPIPFGCEEKALRISESLVEKGFFVPAIRPPSVPQGTSRLRLTVTATHSEVDIEDLVEGLAQVAKQV
jgi:7-keto-8-aminopelargonate synthetase-like enzyme